MMKFMIVTTIAALGFFSAVGSAYAQTDVNCYDLGNLGTVGQVGWTGCEGMYITDDSTLRDAADAGQTSGNYQISFDGTDYTFGDSDNDIFTGQVTTMAELFRANTNFNENIGYWDTSNVTNMSYMFQSSFTSTFNQPLGNWDVSGVTDMSYMFHGADIFDQDISQWDVSRVTKMNSMFRSATAFNKAIGDWDVSRVINMGSMFHTASSFNQPLGNWDVSSVANMGVMFYQAALFNQDISTWNVSLIPTAPANFSDSSALATANMPNWGAGIVVANFDGTLAEGGSTTFTVGLGTVPVADVIIDLTSSDAGEGVLSPAQITFSGGSSAAPQTITLTSPTDSVADGDQSHTVTVAVNTLSTTDGVYANKAPRTLSAVTTDVDIPGVTFSPSTITVAEGAEATFTVQLDTAPLNTVVLDLSSSDTGEGVLSPTQITFAAGDSTAQTVTVTAPMDTVIDGNKTYSITAAVNTASTLDAAYDAVSGATLTAVTTDTTVANNACYNPDNLGTVGQVGWTGCAGMYITNNSTLKAAADAGQTSGDYLISFEGTDYTFGNSANNIFTGQVTTMRNLFTSNSNFNEDVGYWDTSNVTVMSYMFYGANTFNNDISQWDVSRVTDMDIMFYGANIFDQPIGGWDVSRVTRMDGMFRKATAFDQPIGSWDVSSVTNMNSMFATASDFNQSLGDWNVSRVTDMGYMFYEAGAFNQDLTTWNVSQFTSAPTLFSFSSPLTTANKPKWGASIVVANFDGTLAEGESSTFTVELGTVPVADVIIDLTSSDAGEGVLSPTQITFSGGSSAAPQTITLTAPKDGDRDGDQSYTVTVAVNASTSDTTYGNKAPQTLSAVTTDVDIPGLTFSTSTITVAEGAEATFSVQLDTAPQGTVVLDLSSSDPSEGVLSPTQITFAAGDNSAKTVTVTAPTDTVIDGNKTYSITAAVNTASTLDDAYDAVSAATLNAVTTNIDTGEVSVFGISPPSENGPQNAVVAFSLTATSSHDTTVNYSLGGTADLGTDYTDDNAGSVTIPAGSKVVIVDFPVEDDAISERGETIIVSLTSVENVATALNGGDAITVGSFGNKATLTITDNDVPNIGVSATSTLANLVEGGATGTFTLSLETQPVGTVTVGIIPADTQVVVSNGGSALTSLDFDSSNYTGVTLTVTANDDKIADATTTTDINFEIIGADAYIGDFTGLTASTSATVTDDDVADIEKGEITLKDLPEGGATGTFTVKLTSQPTVPVTIALGSQNGELNASSSGSTTLTFGTNTGAGGWDVNQTVTVGAIHDNYDDDADSLDSVTLTVAASGEASVPTSYDGRFTSIAFNIVDHADDVAGLTLSTSTITVAEGAEATFTVQLDTLPQGTVVLDLSSSDTGEGVLSPTQITFAAGENAAQTVTVTAPMDTVIDGNETYSITVAVNASTSDTTYGNKAPRTLSAVTTDVDIPALTLSTSTITVAEGETATFTVQLDTLPQGTVVLDLSSSDPSEGVLSPEQITFAAGENAAQTVTVTAPMDTVIDGNESYSITAAVNTASTLDDVYDAVSAATLTAVTTNINTGAVSVFGISQASENGPHSGSVVFSLSATSSLDTTVNYGLGGTADLGTDYTDDNSGSVTISAGTLGVNAVFPVEDDAISEGGETIIVSLTSVENVATALNGGDAITVGSFGTTTTLTITDNDVPNIGVSATSTLANLVEGGATGTFTLSLDTQPVGTVTVGITPADTQVVVSNGGSALTSLDFDPSNYAGVTLTVTANDDKIADGTTTTDINFEIRGADAYIGDFTGLTTSTSATVTDNDVADIEKGEITLKDLPEGGATGTFTVKLTSQPTVPVTITLGSENGELNASSSGSTTLTFGTNTGAGGWDVNQTVTVGAIHDNYDDDADSSDNVTLTAAASGEASVPTSYDAMSTSVNFTITDHADDVAGLTFSTSTITVAEGAEATFTVQLDTLPQGTVIIDLTSSDIGEGVLRPAQITFAAWVSTAQTVTVTAPTDSVADGDQPYTVTVAVNASTSDSVYGDKAPQTFSAVTTDVDIAGVTFSPSTITVAEGAMATFNVQLDTAPLNTVVLDLSSSDTGEGVVSPEQITFAAGASAAQTVTVTAPIDTVIDGNETYSITAAVNTASTLDDAYDAVAAETLTAVTTDTTVANNACYNPDNLGTVGQVGWTGCAGMYITNNSTLRAAADAGQTSGDYLISFEGTDYTFGDSANNIFTGQVTTMADLFSNNSNFNEDIGYWDASNVTGMTAMFYAATKFNKDISPWDVSSVTNMREVFRHAFAFNQPLGDWEVSGVTDMNAMFYQASAFDQPLGDWDVGRVTDMNAMFAVATKFNQDISTWNVSQFTSVPSNFSDNSSLTEANSPKWGSGIVVANFDGTLAEGESSTFTVGLGTVPVADVIIDLTSSDIGEGVLSPAQITFAAWVSTAQTVTVTAPTDSVADGDQSYTVTVAVSASTSDSVYGDKAPRTLSAVTTDVDIAGVTFSPSTITVAEGAMATFSVQLDTAPLNTVVLDLSSSDTGEGVVSPEQITFAAGVSAAQTVTVTAPIDTVIDGNETYSITAAVNTASTLDDAYDAVAAETLTAVTTDTTVANNGCYNPDNLGTVGQVGWAGCAGMYITNNSTLRAAADAGQTSGDYLISFEGTDYTFGDSANNIFTGQVTTMGDLFTSNRNFNEDIRYWDTSNVTVMSYMFYGATTFNKDISKWDVSRVTDMREVFRHAFAFNQPLGDWEVSGVTDMNAMFYQASAFDQPLGDWDVGRVTDMNAMFAVATKFNQDISTWNVSQFTSVPSNFSDNSSLTEANSPKWGSGIVVANFDGTLAEGESSTFTVGLGTVPVADVIIDLTSSDIGEGVLSPAQITFAAWVSTAQTVTVTAPTDSVADGDQSYTVTVAVSASTSDSVYGDKAPRTLSAVTTDVDIAGVTFSPSTITVAEGAMATFNVQLDTAPLNTVVLDLSSSDTGEGVVSPEQITFAAGVSAAQTVTVTAPIDTVIDGNETYSITAAVNTASTLDDAYDAVAAETLTAVTTDATVANNGCYNPDNLGTVGQVGWAGCAGMYITNNSTLRAAADAGQTSGDYLISFEGTDYTFGDSANNIFTGQVTTMGDLFTSNRNFNEDIRYWDTSNVTVMSYMFYGATTFNKDISKWDVSRVTDMREVFRHAFAFNQPLGDWEVSGVTDMNAMFYQASAFDQPLGDWDVGSVTDMNAMFAVATKFNQDISTWNVSQFTSVPSNFSDNSSLTEANSPKWGSGIVVANFDGTLAEGESSTFTVGLGTVPVADVIIDLTSSDIGEGVLSPAQITFAAWVSTAQTVTVTAPTDSVADGDQSYTVTVAVSASTSDSVYGDKAPRTLSAVTTDVDIAGVTFSPSTITVAEGAMATFSVQLDTAPLNTVVLDLSSSDTGEGVVSPEQITFAAGVSAAQTVTVTAPIDTVIDGNETYSITAAVNTASTLDDAYDAVAAETLTAVTTDTTVANNGCYNPDNLGTVGQVGWAGCAGMYITNNSTLRAAADAGQTSGDYLISFEGTDYTFGDSANNIFTGQVTTMGDLFTSNRNFNEDIGYWDTSNVTVMSYMFYGATTFNKDISKWDVSRVTDMREVFRYAFAFNQPLGDWEVSGVTDMNAMFYQASAFDQPLGDWDVGSVTDMNNMFNVATKFNQDISTWNVSQFTSVPSNFSDNSSLTEANSPKWGSGIVVANFDGTLAEGESSTFTVGLGTVPVADVIIDLTSSDIGEGVLSPTQITFAAWVSTAQTVTVTAPTDSVADGDQPYTVTVAVSASTSDSVYGDKAPRTLSAVTTDVDIAGVTFSPSTITVAEGAEATFTVQLDTAPLGTVVLDLRSSDTGEGVVSPEQITFAAGVSAAQTVTVTAPTDTVIDGNETYSITAAVNTASTLDAAYDAVAAETVTAVTTDTTVANNGCYNPDNLGTVGQVGWAGCAGMYITNNSTLRAAADAGQTSGDYQISFEGTDYTFGDSANNIFTGQVTTMRALFAANSNFNKDIGYWDTSNVTEMGWTFNGASTFDQDISKWDTSSVTLMPYMFWQATDFNKPLGDWDVSSVTRMDGMFREATAFDQPIGSWDVSSVTTFEWMFFESETFNQDISTWDVTSATNMKDMFRSATAFNKPIGDWNVSSVTDMTSMFATASVFNQPLGDWDVSGATNMGYMFYQASLFNQDLSSWNVSQFIAEPRGFHAQTPLDIATNAHLRPLWGKGIVVEKFDGTLAEGESSTFTVEISTVPVADVVIDLTSSDAGEGVLSPTQITFSGGSSAGPQTITLTAPMDSVADGDQPYTVTVAVNASTLDSVYGNKAPQTLSAVTTDVDIAGLTFSTSTITVAEGATATFNVQLYKEPQGTVVLDLSSSDTGEGVLSPEQITFAAGDSTAQTVTVTAPTDTVIDGNETYSITAAVNTASTLDDAYDAVSAATLIAVTTDTTNATLSFSDVIDASEGATSSVTVSTGGVTSESEIIIGYEASGGTAGSEDYTSASAVTIPVGATSTKIEYFFKDDDLIEPSETVVVQITSAETTVEGATTTLNLPTSNNATLTAANINTVVVSVGATTQPSENGPQSGAVTFTQSATSSHDTIVSYSLGGTADLGADYTDYNSGSVTIPAGSLTAEAVFSVVDDVIGEGDETIIVTLTSVDNDGTAVGGGDAITVDTDNNAAILTITDNDVAGVVNTACYNPDNLGTVGQVGWTGCAGMYITDDSTLRAAADAGQTSGDYQISFEGTDYTFGDSANNIFTGQVTTMRALFAANSNFNKDIGYWDTSNVTEMGWTFNGASTFDQDISKWDTSSVTLMPYMFWQATDFNKPLGDWDVSSVTRMDGMFREATAFDQPIGSWDVSSVTTFEWMFFESETFNQDISTWDVTSATNMKDMFRSATAFNKPIGDWNVSSVTDMTSMFATASVFNQPLGDWDVSGATNMGYMFYQASLFNQDLSSWNVSQFANLNSFGASSGMDAANFPNWGTGIVVANFDGTLAEGESSTFTVEISTVPVADVVIDLTSSDTGEGVLSPTQITFSGGSSAGPQTITLTAPTDSVADGDQPYTVTVAVNASTSDSVYANKAPRTLSAVTTDVDIAALTLSTSSKVIDATPPTLTADSENSTTKLVKGTGDAGETIVVSYTDKGGNAATATTTVAADGTWSITLNPAAKSNTAVTVTSTDANGNTATVTIASIASADIDAVEIQQDIEEVMVASGEMVIATVPSVGSFISAGSTAILSAPKSVADTRANIKASDGSFAANLVAEGLRLSLNTTDSKTSAHIHTNDFKLGYDKGVGTLKASFTTQQMHVEIDETAAKTKLKFDGRLTPTRTKADRAGTINGWVSGELLRSEGSGNKMDLFVGRVGAHKFHDTDSLTGLMLTTDSGTGTFAADGFTTDNTVKIRSYMIGVYHGQKMQTAAGNSYNIEGQLHFGTSKMDLTTPAGDTGSTNGSRILATGRMSSDTTFGGYKFSPFIQGDYFNQKNDGFATAQNNTVVAATKVSFADVALGTKFNYAQANGMTIGFEPSLVYRAKASGSGLNIDERTIRGRVSMDFDIPLQSAGGRLTTNVYLDGIGIASSRTYGASIKFERQF